MALTRPDVYTDREAAAHGPGWRATHDGMFEESVRQSALLSELGVLSVFSSGTNPIPHERLPSATIAYGNRTGGVIGGNTNLTTKSFQNSFNGDWSLGRVRSFMYSVPEVDYMLEEFERRNISHRWMYSQPRAQRGALTSLS